jgi:cell division protein ZapA
MTVDRTERSSMATVNVTINARQYRMACEDGQEQHLLRLAEDLDQRITKLHESFGEVGDTRLTVMAALTLADELAESAKRIRRLEEELAGLQDARVVSADRAQATQAAIASAFNSAAERIENLAKSLNQGLGDGGVAMG